MQTHRTHRTHEVAIEGPRKVGTSGTTAPISLAKPSKDTSATVLMSEMQMTPNVATGMSNPPSPLVGIPPHVS